MQKKYIILGVFGFFSALSYGTRYNTSYLGFNLLNNWQCQPMGTEHVCSNKLSKKKAAEAMIILTAKQKGPGDNLASFLKYLKSPKQNKANKSKVYHANQKIIHNHTWVDGFHSGSEVPTYYTRYLVTVKGGLAVLITYSAHKNHYSKYANDFQNSINSLRLSNIPTNLGGGVGGSRGMKGMGSTQDYIQDMIAQAEQEEWGDGGADGQGLGFLSRLTQPEVVGTGLLFLALLAYFALKKRRNRKLKKRQLETRSGSYSKRRRSGSSSRRRRRAS